MIILLGVLFGILPFLSVVLIVDALTHFHILWFLPKYPNETFVDALPLERLLYRVIRDAWCVNLGSKRVPKYVPLFTYHEKYVNGKLRSNYDTHFVRPSLTADGVSSVAFYVCKYMLKGSNKERRLQQALRLNLVREEYDLVYDIVKSKTLRSSSFGLGFPDNTAGIIQHLKKGIQLSKASSKFPMFYAPDSQKTFPLCPYYRMRGDIFTERDWLDFHMNDPSVFLDFDKTVTHCKNGEATLSKQISLMELHDLSLDF